MKKYSLAGVILLALAACVNACTDQGVPPAAAPTIASLQPDSAAVGDTIKVSGAGFGVAQGASAVKFGATGVSVYLSWSATEIRVKVPAGAATGSVTVTVDGLVSNAAQFRLLIPASAPVISSVTPSSPRVGDTLLISGLRFGSTQLTSIVVFPTKTGTVSGSTYPVWNATTVKVVVPATAIHGIVYVEVGGIASNTAAFNGPLSFALDVQPILNFGCAIAGCHTGSSPPAGFNQSTYAGVRAGGINYGSNVVITGDSSNSEIIRAMRGTATVGRMPFGGPWVTSGVPDSNIVKVATWIKQGASDN